MRGGRQRRLGLRGAVFLLGAAAAFAAAAAPPQPRWMYELGVGEFHPRLDEFGTYYGVDAATTYSLAAAYRFNGWLEAGARLAYLREDGVGAAAGSGGTGGQVRYALVPFELFASFMLPGRDRRFVPYLGLGVATAAYDERIELQPDHKGRGGFGPAVDAGLRWRFASSGGPRSGEFWRGYVFGQASRFSSRAAGYDLGGTLYTLGVRVEFQIGRTP